MINAKKIRDTDYLKTIPNNKPGYYKWWAREKEAILLVKKLGYDFNEYKKYMEVKDDLYCIYIGIAVKESIRNRLNWHVNDKHDYNSVKTGFLSTFRKSIAALITGNLLDKDGTNKFIDKLFIEYFTINDDIKSLSAKNKIEDIEKKSLLRNLYILNIKDNKFKYASDIKKSLRKKRRVALKKFD